jgi:YegS/Rv2252/BmrU family lipid kinase
MQVLVILNSKHRLSNDVNALLDGLTADEAIDLTLKKTRRKKHAKKLAKKHGEEQDVVIGIGGDGTFHELVNGIKKAGYQTPIGFVPNGTGNDFVRMFEPFESSTFIDRIQQKEYTNIDLGYLQSKRKERYFINIAGVGLDGKVIQLVERSAQKGRSGRLSYANAILRAFFTFRKPYLHIQGDDFEYRGPVMLLAMCSGRVFGDGLIIGPQASLTSGKMNITLLGKITLVDYLLNLGKLKKGKVINHKQVFYHETTTLRVNRISGEVPGEADGEVLKMKSFSMRVLPEGLTVVNELKN